MKSIAARQKKVAASLKAKQLLVNGVFFVVYPCVLLYRWYNSRRWTLWTECSEKDDIMQFVDYSREEEELLRHGMIRGRMIVQTEIVLSGALEDELSSSYEKYDNVVVGVVKQPLGEENNPSECVPLNLSKDGEGLDNEELILPEYRREERTKMDTTLSSAEEDGDDDEIRLIPSPSSRANDTSLRVIAETLIK
uniref:Uncharacterized protein n=1 Tax=Anopheles culicifacies TaxID=139723 RepID=A0A182LZ84_9DIPT